MKYGSTFWFASTKLEEGVRQKGQGLRNRSLFASEAQTNGCIELLWQGLLVFKTSLLERTVTIFFFSSMRCVLDPIKERVIQRCWKPQSNFVPVFQRWALYSLSLILSFAESSLYLWERSCALRSIYPRAFSSPPFSPETSRWIQKRT